MPIDPLELSNAISERFERYLLTTFGVAPEYSGLGDQFKQRIREPGRLFRGPYLQGLPPYIREESLQNLVDDGILPDRICKIPFLGHPTQELYSHQSRTIRQLREGRNAVVTSGTGSGKTLCFLVPILSEILENPEPGIHAMLLYPMNALVQDQLKVLRHLLKDHPDIRFGRYVNINITPESETRARDLHPDALENEVISRQVFRENPPHILITNYSMLEYLLMRSDDSPLFHGPWRFIAVDETHTYTGAKGSEVALLMRRLLARIKKPTEPPPQYISTSATIGASDTETREEVASFASKLFNSSFKAEDVIESERAVLPLGQDLQIKKSIYTHPALVRACEDEKWSDEFSAVLTDMGFASDIVTLAEKTAQVSFSEGLCEVFRHDSRIKLLREAVEVVPDLPAAAHHVFESREEKAVQTLIGLVRIASLAKYPNMDARLVPCRYHFFVRGLSGGYIAFDHEGEKGKHEPSLFLEPTNTTPDEAHKTVELQVCRKCGQPYVFAYEFQEGDRRILKAFGSPLEGRGTPVWFTWDPPEPVSEDEEDEVKEGEKIGTRATYCSRCGVYDSGDSCECGCNDEASHIPFWFLKEGPEITKCFACGGQNTVTGLRADSNAAQAAVAESFYRHLPASKDSRVLSYPGKGRKLLCFSDSRQQAAYFAPYLGHTHRVQMLRWLIYNALLQAGGKTGSVSANAVIDYIIHLNQTQRFFPWDMEDHDIRLEAQRALIAEFCLPFSRRQSLEALALTSMSIELSDFYDFPKSFSALGFEEHEQRDLMQVLLSSLRMQKIVTMPPPLSPRDEAFAPKLGPDAAVARESENGARWRLQGFVPVAGVSRQRRSFFLKKVLDRVSKRNGKPEVSDDDVLQYLYDIWRSLTQVDGPAPVLPTTRVEVTPGKSGHQFRWEALRLGCPEKWYYCPTCNQWTPWNVGGVCPSFRCPGELIEADPEHVMPDNHYRHIYTREQPAPLVAKEHTAQLTPAVATLYQEAFQNGHSRDEGQINVLSCSTTFELGVDLGDLEAVFLRDMPPSPTNYQQRAGRAGRGVGTAAFVVTFSLPRSHDEYFFAIPEEMVAGVVPPPRIHLDNDVIVRRHIQAVLLSEFIRANYPNIRSIGDFLEEPDKNQSAPVEVFFENLEELVETHKSTIRPLIPDNFTEAYLGQVAQYAIQYVSDARNHYVNELKMFEDAYREANRRHRKTMDAKKFGDAKKIAGFLTYLSKRMDSLKRVDWVTFFSDRGVLPRYAFPIYNVNLETSDSGLDLDRDLRIALSEYAPGAKVVANERLWESIGIKLPPNGALQAQFYARCPNCWYVERHLQRGAIFQGGKCPVCDHDGRSPARRKHFYVVPDYGFTTDLEKGGDPIAFDRPVRIPSSRVLFVPQQDSEDPVVFTMGQSGRRVSLRTTDLADFFVFNDGEDGSGRGFNICRSCGMKLDNYKPGEPHRRPFGGECRGRPQWQHLGHEFRGSAARLLFDGTGYAYTDHGFWLSLMYALLGGMSEVLNIESADIDGIIRPIRVDDHILQEVVLFDSVPGGAGHVKRLELQDEFRAVLDAAYRRVENCSCGRDASCYKCLRHYRNQYAHDILERGPISEYLGQLILEAGINWDEDVRYIHSDRASALRALIDRNSRVYLITNEVTPTGPAETGPWHILLQSCASRIGKGLKLAVKSLSEDEGATASLLLLHQSGARIYKMKDGVEAPPYAMLGVTAEGRRAAFHFGKKKITVLDSLTHRQPLWQNRSAKRLEEAEEMLEDWFKNCAEELTVFDLVETGYKTHGFEEGDRVDFSWIFAADMENNIEEIIIQDPYLRNAHQIACLGSLLEAYQPLISKGPIRVKLITKLSDQSRDRYAFIPGEHRKKLEEAFAPFSEYNPTIDIRGYRDRIHARFIYVQGSEGGERLFYLDRGLDIIDPRTGLARGGPILEFRQPDAALKETFLHQE